MILRCCVIVAFCVQAAAFWPGKTEDGKDDTTQNSPVPETAEKDGETHTDTSEIDSKFGKQQGNDANLQDAGEDPNMRNTDEEMDRAKQVKCQTTAGSFVIDLQREWAPIGVRRFVEMVASGWFQGVPLFRVVPHFITQFAHSADSTQEEKFNGMRFPDDHPDEELYRWNKDHKTGADKKYFPMEYGTIFFAGGGGEDSRASDLCITLCGKVDHPSDCGGIGHRPWEVPVGIIARDTLAAIHRIEAGGYGDMPPWGKGPDPESIADDSTRTAENPLGTYLANDFANVDYFKDCSLVL